MKYVKIEDSDCSFTESIIKGYKNCEDDDEKIAYLEDMKKHCSVDGFRELLSSIELRISSEAAEIQSYLTDNCIPLSNAKANLLKHWCSFGNLVD